MVVVKRTKWHLIAGIFGCAVFVYPCLFGVPHASSPLWFWLTKAFLFLFIVPLVTYCICQIKHQEDAITIEDGRIRFATMLPWGRSTLDLDDIVDCTFECIPEVHDHLVISVTPSCFDTEFESWTWAACEETQLRFDMMYTSPGPKETSQQILRVIDDRRGKLAN